MCTFTPANSRELRAFPFASSIGGAPTGHYGCPAGEVESRPSPGKDVLRRKFTPEVLRIRGPGFWPQRGDWNRAKMPWDYIIANGSLLKRGQCTVYDAIPVSPDLTGLIEGTPIVAALCCGQNP